MSNFDHAWLNAMLDEHAEEGRDVQLFSINGVSIFPLYHSSGVLCTDAVVFPILRGRGEKAPAYSGPFPQDDGVTLELGQDWIAMCVRLPYHLTAHEKIAKLEEAEQKLRAMKVR